MHKALKANSPTTPHNSCQLDPEWLPEIAPHYYKKKDIIDEVPRSRPQPPLAHMRGKVKSNSTKARSASIKSTHPPQRQTKVKMPKKKGASRKDLAHP